MDQNKGIKAIKTLIALCIVGRMSGLVRPWAGLPYNYRNHRLTAKTRWKRGRRCHG